MNTKTKEGARNKGNPYFLRVPWNKGGLVNTDPGSCLPLVSSLQYRTLTNCMYWFPLPFQLPVVI